MKIKCLTKFIHERDTFEKDDERTVDDERGNYFISQAWAQEVGQSVSLDIKNAKLGLGDTNDG